MRIELLNGGVPKIYFTPKADSKMKAFVSLSTDEIGWLGDVVKLNDTDYLVQDVFLLKQEVNGTTCELDSSSIADLYEERICLGEAVDTIKLWGHSHVNMGVNPSTQDETQFTELYSQNEDFFIRLIANKRNEFNITLVDIKRGVKFSELSYSIYLPNIVDLTSIAQEIKDKVTKKAYVMPVYQKGGRVGYNTHNPLSPYYGNYENYDEDYSYLGNGGKKYGLK